MPYRRLPNTDTARYNAIETAVNKCFSLHPSEVPFSQKLLLQLKSFLPLYRQAITIYRENSAQQKKISDQHHSNTKKLKMYISHFIQVLNFAILRGEIKEKARTYFGVSESATNLPQIKNDNDLKVWSERLIEGEDLRIREGGVAMTNPRIALIKIRYDEYLKTLQSYKVSQQSKTTAQEKVAELRSQADELILQLWNEIEDHFSNSVSDDKRDKCATFGIKYVYRPSER